MGAAPWNGKAANSRAEDPIYSLRICRYALVAVLDTQDVFADIGPELFEDVGAGGDDGLCSEVLRRLVEATLFRGIVEVRQAGFGGIATDLGDIELLAARIVLGDEGARLGV